jgi:predicted RNA-binding Zn-ribbon protein involved in translation (DUF1610 family)
VTAITSTSRLACLQYGAVKSERRRNRRVKLVASTSSITAVCPNCGASAVLTLIRSGDEITQQELEFFCPNGDVLEDMSVVRLWVEGHLPTAG